MTGDGQALRFDSFEEMQEAEAKQSIIAKTWISDEQRLLGDLKKHYFVKPLPMDSQILFIFGWTWDLDRDREEALTEPEGEDRDGKLEDNAMLREAVERGYVFTRSFSVLCENGELGSHHLASIIPISEGEFEEARQARWEPTLSVMKAISDFIKRYRK